MMLRTKLKLRNFLRDALLTILLAIIMITLYGIAGTMDYEVYCWEHPNQCATTK